MTDVVVVTGAGGMGRACARRMGSGRRVLIADNSVASVDALVTALRTDGFSAEGMVVDVRRHEGAKRYDAQTARPDVVERIRYEMAAETAALRRRLDLGVHEHNSPWFQAVKNLTNQLITHEQLRAKLGRIVPHDIVAIGHGIRLAATQPREFADWHAAS